MKINQNFPYHSVDADEAIDRLHSNKNGLHPDERKRRLTEFGQNKLEDKEKASILSIVLKQFKDFLVYVLLAAAVISYFTGHMIDFYVIIGVIIVNAIIGFSQEFKAEKSIESLKKLISHNATVLEDGERKIIDVIDDLPFNSEQKFRASLVSYPDEHREMLFLGAPEKIHELSNQSMRVIGCAYKSTDQKTEVVNKEDASDLVFTALYGIMDPPRKEVKDAVQKCKDPGFFWLHHLTVGRY